MCEIIKCVKEKYYNSCAESNDYVCRKLQKLYDTDSSGKVLLDIVKAAV
jgi:hypothetical protein